MHKVQIHQHGGPEVLSYDWVSKPKAKADEVSVKITYAGVNFRDMYERSGGYKADKFPFALGIDGSGVVEQIGSDVKDRKVGDRVSWMGIHGTYADYICIKSDRVVLIDDTIDMRIGCAMMTQGITAHYLLTTTCPTQKGDTVLIHAGAGGTGGILIQIGKLLGATVITTVSTAEKAKIAKDLGADHVINYTTQDFHEQVMKITNGNGVKGVIDGVGKDTWRKSLACISPRGYLVCFGASSGNVPPVEPKLLNKQGSINFSRPSSRHHVLGDMLQKRATELQQWIKEGKVKIRIDRVFPLFAAAEAHQEIEGRTTLGKLLLVPEEGATFSKM